MLVCVCFMCFWIFNIVSHKSLLNPLLMEGLVYRAFSTCSLLKGREGFPDVGLLC